MQNILHQIKHAFNEKGISIPEGIEIEKEIYDINGEKLEASLTIKCQGKFIHKFDIWGYSFLGYQELSDFIRACWKEPSKITDLFALKGFHNTCSKGGYARWSVEELADACDSHPTQWKPGTVVKITEPLCQSADDYDKKGFLIREGHYYLHPFGQNQIKCLPPGTQFTVKESLVNSWKEDNYGDISTVYEITGTS